MKYFAIILFVLFATACEENIQENADAKQRIATEKIMAEADKQIGMPAIKNFQERKLLKWIYELCDQEKMICHAYLMNELSGTIGQYLGECLGYGIPYSTQFSNPQKLVRMYDNSSSYHDKTSMPQAEPNGLFKPEGLSATWLIMIDPTTREPRPVYIEPLIIVSPFKLK